MVKFGSKVYLVSDPKLFRVEIFTSGYWKCMFVDLLNIFTSYVVDNIGPPISIHY